MSCGKDCGQALMELGGQADASSSLPTSTSGSWLNLVEVWFGIIDRQAIRPGVFTSLKDLNATIRQFIGPHKGEP